MACDILTFGDFYMACKMVQTMKKVNPFCKGRVKQSLSPYIANGHSNLVLHLSSSMNKPVSGNLICCPSMSAHLFLRHVSSTVLLQKGQ